jgi:hypothetical protein
VLSSLTETCLGSHCPRVSFSCVCLVGGRGDHGGRRSRDEEGRKEASGSRSHHDRDPGECMLRHCQGSAKGSAGKQAEAPSMRT